MTTQEILQHLVRMTDRDNDATLVLIGLAGSVSERGLIEDEDPSATAEACAEVKTVALELRKLARHAKVILESQPS